MLGVGRGNILAFDPATHAMSLHQQPDPFLAYTQPSATQPLMDSWPPVFPLDLAVDGLDVNYHPLIRQPRTRWPAARAGAFTGVAATPSSPRCCWRTQLPTLAFGMPSELATESTDAPASTCRTLSTHAGKMMSWRARKKETEPRSGI